MNKIMDQLMLVALVSASLWDGFTTVYGTSRILGGDPVQVIASGLFGLLVLVFMLNSRAIISGKDDAKTAIGRVLWFTAIAYDLYTAWVGNARFLVGESVSGERTAILIGVTIMVSGSPVLLSFRYGNDGESG